MRVPNWVRDFAGTALNTYLVVGMSFLLVWAADAVPRYSVDWVAIIAAVSGGIVAIVTSLGGLYVVYNKVKGVEESQGKLADTQKELSIHINSKMDELLKLTRESAFAAGGAAERERSTGEAKPQTAPTKT